MPGEAQPLFSNQTIVDEKGFPTQYFIRWAQQRQVDISKGITAVEAQQLIDDWAASRKIIAGVALHGGGDLSADRTIDHDESLVTPGIYGTATKVPRILVDQEGHIQGVTEVAISGGGGGSAPWYLQPTAASAFTLMSGDSTNFVLTDDTDIGLCVNGGAPQNSQALRTALIAVTPASTYTVISLLNFIQYDQNGRAFGLILYDSVADRAIVFTNAETGHNLQVLRWNGLTSYNSISLNRPIFMPNTWMKIAHTSGNYNFYTSADGKNWALAFSEADTAWLTNRANYVGIFHQNSSIASSDMPNVGSVPYFQIT